MLTKKLFRDGAMRSLGKHAAKLEELTVMTCSNVTDKGVDELAKGCQALRKLRYAPAPHVKRFTPPRLITCYFSCAQPTPHMLAPALHLLTCACASLSSYARERATYVSPPA